MNLKVGYLFTYFFSFCNKKVQRKKYDFLGIFKGYFNPNWHEGGHFLPLVLSILSAEFLSNNSKLSGGENLYKSS